MQDLYKMNAYPQALRDLIQREGQGAVELANRWMLGWPKLVAKLIAADEYEAAFLNQLEQERELLAKETEYSYLTRTELYQFFGLSAAPPTLS